MATLNDARNCETDPKAAFNVAAQIWQVSRQMDMLMKFIGDDAEKIGQYVIDHITTTEEKFMGTIKTFTRLPSITRLLLSDFYGRPVELNDDETELIFADEPALVEQNNLVAWLRTFDWTTGRAR